VEECDERGYIDVVAMCRLSDGKSTCDYLPRDATNQRVSITIKRERECIHSIVSVVKYV
jgi:hypothetical protein